MAPNMILRAMATERAPLGSSFNVDDTVELLGPAPKLRDLSVKRDRGSKGTRTHSTNTHGSQSPERILEACLLTGGLRRTHVAHVHARHGIEFQAGETGVEQGAFAGPEEWNDRQIGFNKNPLRFVVKFDPFVDIELPGTNSSS